jgi:hypothetical protein
MPKPTYEDHAALIERAIIALAASDAAIDPSVRANLPGYVPSLAAMRAELRSLGLNADDLPYDELLPAKSHAVYGSDAGFIDLVSVERMSFQEALRLRLLTGRKERHFCRSHCTSILESGKVIQHNPVVYCAVGNDWQVFDKRAYKKTGEVVKTNWQRGTWEQFAVLECSLDPLPQMSAFYEWGRRCVWSIELSMPSAPAVVVSTDPIGAKELLRMRDVPEGKSRREALRHWVKEHWRQNRKDAEVEHIVRAHLRGQDECEWFGLWCKIVPSEIDRAKDKMPAQHQWRRRAV